MFTGTSTGTRGSNATFRRAIAQKVISRPSSGLGSGADHA